MKPTPSKRPTLRPAARASGPLTAPIRRARFFWVAVAFIGWTAAIALRLTWLQVIKHVEAANLKDEQASVNTDNDGNTLIFLNLVSSRRQHRIQMC